MNKFNKKWKYLILLIIMPVLGVIYDVINTNERKIYHLTTNIDDKLPFINIFIIPYIAWYFFIFFYLLYFFFKELKVYLETLLIIVIGEIICFLIYYFFQTTVERPVLHNEGLFNRLTIFIYNHDEPYNCFPSLHVLTTYAVMNSFSKIEVKQFYNSVFLYGLGTLIIISTVFVKQHVIIDVLSSVFLVLLLSKVLKFIKVKEFKYKQ